MKTRWLLLVMVPFLALPRVAEAQIDDVNRPRPVVMLGIDTSGSMEYLADGTLPTCGDGTDEYNRFNIALEALTGSFGAWQCANVDRAVTYPGQIDETYYLMHYTPTPAAIASQMSNGILDTYRERVKFGLMTFDSWGGGPTYPDPQGLADDITGMWSYGHDHRYQCQQDLDGDGDIDCAGWDFWWDAGARRSCDMPAPAASCPAGKEVLGGMISVGASDVQANIDSVNAAIQSELLAIRPFGATPLAALLDDMHLYFGRNTDVNAGGGGKRGNGARNGGADGESDDDVLPVGHDFGTVTGQDAYAACRPKFGLLFTDGIANVDARPFCETYPAGAGFGCTCPYGTAPEQAELLKNDGIPVFVIGFAVEAATPLERLQIRRALWEIAESGGTAEPCDDACAPADVACHTNLMADPPTCPTLINPATNTYHVGAIIVDCDVADPTACRASVASAFATILDAIGGGSSSRTMPAHSLAVTDPSDANAPAAMDEFTGRFTVSAGSPWTGQLSRARWECNAGALDLRAPDPTTDQFDDILNKRAAARRILTFEPTGGAPALQTTLTAADGNERPFTKALLPAYFGAWSGQRDDVVDFVRADNGFRDDRRLGDIYHSAPVVHPRLEGRFGSQSYTDFVLAQQDRVPVLFVGTNDGMLHAFNASATAAQGAGDEMWAFIPPFHLPNLGAQMPSNHQFYMDGTVSVADILPRFERGVSPVGADWRTVLVAGMRQGGNAWVALDVTNALNPGPIPVPGDPEMLWQITDAAFGQTYGAAQIAKVFVQLPAETEPSERAVAILVGGAGELSGPGGCNRQANSSPGAFGPQVRFWTPEGRHLRIVDLMSGVTIADWGASNYGGPEDQDNPIDSPLVGTPAIYLQGFDVTMKRAFITDADGTIWRLYTDHIDPTRWRLEIFHDMFATSPVGDRQPSYDQPALTTDAQNRVVVIAGTGDPDSLTAAVPGPNIVVSVTEELDVVATTFTPILNWTLSTPDDDEKVTGPITITDEVAYFTTYVPGLPTAADACVAGHARIWGVDYLRPVGPPNGPPIPKLWLDFDGNPANGNELQGQAAVLGGPTLDGGYAEDMPGGSVLFGLQAVRRPSCVEVSSIVDPLGFTRDQIQSIAPAEWALVAQLPGDMATAVGLPSFANASGAQGAIEIRQAARVMQTRIDSWGSLVE